MKNTLYKCPVCNQPVEKAEKSYYCSNNHTYDISKNGYVNLLLVNQKKSINPGDSKDMLLHRKDLLNAGYYKNLSDLITKITKEFIEKNKLEDISILDMGCGEGYYLSNLIINLDADHDFYGMDVSKEAINLAAKRNCNAEFSVSNSYTLPFMDNSFSVIYSVFSPTDENEILRTLKKDSIIIVIGPGSRHLFDLVKLIYDEPRLHVYENKLNKSVNFKLIEEHKLNYFVDLQTKEDIKNLFMMTPYFWQVSPEKREKILGFDNLKMEVDFDIKVFIKVI